MLIAERSCHRPPAPGPGGQDRDRDARELWRVLPSTPAPELQHTLQQTALSPRAPFNYSLH